MFRSLVGLTSSVLFTQRLVRLEEVTAMARLKKTEPLAGEIGDPSDAEFIIANPSEMDALKDVERLLAESSQAKTSDTSNSENTGLIIVGPGGRKVPVPASLRVAALRFVRLV